MRLRFIPHEKIVWHKLNAMGVTNNFMGDLNEAETAYLATLERAGNGHIVLSSNKFLRTDRKLPSRPPESLLPVAVKKRLEDHVRYGDNSRRTREVLLIYNLIQTNRGGRALGPYSAADRKARKRSQIRGWYQEHREHLAAYNKDRRRNIKARLQKLKDLETIQLAKCVSNGAVPEY
jgi:hypothetical protein